MPNGRGLLGDQTTTQSSIIVPNPGDSNLYYIFTADFQLSDDGLNYSVVDMSADGGLGDVITKNIQLRTPTTEKLAAVRHKNGKDFWVLTKDWGNADYLAYLVDENGVSTTPVVSTGALSLNFPPEYPFHFRANGYLKISPNAKRVVACHLRFGVEVMDFDNGTGMVSNATVLFQNTDTRDANYYGAEFSPNSKVLYLTKNFNYALFQYDLTAPNIKATEIDLLNNDRIEHFGMQLGIDGKIYITEQRQNYLSVINEPNILGAGCNYSYRQINLARRCNLGLPQFIASNLIGKVNAENLCFGDSTVFSADTTEPITSISWDFGDGTTSSDETPNHVFSTVGNYTITYDAVINGRKVYGEREITIINSPIANTPTNLVQCNDNNATVNFDLNLTAMEILGAQNTSDLSLTFYLTQQDADLGQNAITTNTVTTNASLTTVYARLENIADNSCFDVTSFDLVVSTTPSINSVQSNLGCDIDGDNQYEFDLIQIATEIEANQTNTAVRFFESQADAQANANALGTTYENASNPQELFFRIENTDNTACFELGSFQLQVIQSAVAGQAPDLVVCDNDETGTYFFDLSVQDSFILAGQSQNAYNISYHASETDANSNSNALATNSYTNTTLNDTVWARIGVASNPNCFDVSSFQVIVNTPPNAGLEEEYVICPDSPDLIITAPVFDTYEWRDENQQLLVDTQNFDVPSIGKYSLRVTQNTNGVFCESTHFFEVFSSGAPDDFIVETDGISNVVNLTIVAEGVGDFEYSIDGDNYQPSASFQVLPGTYEVFVRDPFGCRELSKEIVAIGYANFFTPNNDDANDIWNIVGANIYPGSVVYIFDRYGKLLKQFDANGSGWDGTILGRPMPASDYWFKFEYEVGKVVTGHFALKTISNLFLLLQHFNFVS